MIFYLLYFTCEEVCLSKQLMFCFAFAAEEDVQIFGGNRTSPNLFHRMHFEEDFALISARLEESE